jgi:hypothetical protein
MKATILTSFLLSLTIASMAQTKDHISIEVNYGLIGNFFVRSYDETIAPPAQLFYKKNFVGTAGGLEVKYNLSQRSSVNFGFAKSTNKREISFDNGSNVLIKFFDISHINHFYQLAFETSPSKKLKDLRIQGGFFYLRTEQQEVEVSPLGGLFEQRDFKNYKLEEGGMFVGIQYSKRIDTKFDLGIRARVYYTISTNRFEAVTLTPTLTYHFK